MHVVEKGGLFYFIGRVRTNSGIVFFDSHQDWLEFVVIYNTWTSHVNFIEKIQLEGIKLCAIFGGTIIFSLLIGSF